MVTTMPRPGQLTRSRANRAVKTPGGRIVIHRRKIYSTKGRCAITGALLQLPKDSKPGRSHRASRSSKRPNRPYGGYASPRAVQRGIIRAVREGSY
ncbi:MAG: 50S ribosomal protein L34e [Candidatus Thorarchaeota archaeon]|nr:MAG: 50S ribosomal protein L34e [Candidatus Thorarchaeota archaeon]RLI52593.1 MAG: 50S ribosomal protein L34e [Candidatus Thorarchaeota archaeon]RLI60059.1 MAG: 50S ribosomal protein L34e [Candidatus Thorarchaeota archaeon]